MASASTEPISPIPGAAPSRKGRSSRPARAWLWLLAWLLATAYFQVPPREVMDTSLDRSNYATYNHFFGHGFQWGSRIFPMPGPYGFVVFGYCYSGEAYWPRYVIDLLLKAAFAATLLYAFRRARHGPARWVWLAAVVLMVPTVDDLFHDFAALLAALVLVAEPRGHHPAWRYLAAIQLGILALCKGTHTLMIPVFLLLAAAANTDAAERRPFLRVLGASLAAALGAWLLAGQNPFHIPGFLHGVLELSTGYNAVMGLDEPVFIRNAGLALAAGVALLLAFVALAARPGSRRRLIAFLLLAGFSFIKWKHGFTRADGHVTIFFTAIAVVAPTVWLSGFSTLLDERMPVQSKGRRHAGVALLTAVTGFAVLGASEFWLWRVAMVFGDAPGRLLHGLSYTVMPAAFRHELDKNLERNRREAHVPQIQNEIGDGPVDFFGNEEGLLLLNRLNYQPRPMGGGTFNVFTPWLQERNEAFVRDDTLGPRWQVMKLATIDDRLPAADDPLTLRAVLDLYTPVLMQRDYLLLHRRTRPTPSTAPAPLGTHSFRPGEAVEVPDPGPGRFVLFTLHAPLDARGRVRSLVYREPALRMTATVDGLAQPPTFVVKPILVQRPVILSPLLRDNLDVLGLYGQQPGRTVRSLRFEAEPGFETDAFSVTFYSAPRPAPPEDGDIREIMTYVEFPLYNRQPSEVTTQDTGIHELNKEPITLVHAPGSITWDLKKEDQQVIFSYGLMPQSYVDGGRTDGVEFNVEVLWPPNDGRVIFRRMMRPVTVPDDRGMQRARVYLPPYEPGARLRIRTHPGPDNDGAYDQSYIARLQIKSGPLVPEQFNGLGAVPADGRLPHLAVAGIGTRPVYLVHAPGEVTLRIPAGAAKFSCEIGLLPGAYQDGGRTDGVEYSFETVLPDGTHATVARHYLDPLHRSEDRGFVPFEVSLPSLPDGSLLRIATGIGPNGDRGWDQAFITGSAFR